MERNDSLRVSLIQSFDNVQEQLSKTVASSVSGVAHRELDALVHGLESLKDFVDFVSDEAEPPTDNSVFWGLVGLVFHVSVNLYFHLTLISNCV